MAQTATDTMGVSLTVTSECTVASGDLSFGSTGLIDSAIDAEGTVTVTCTQASPFQLGLSAGTTTGATVSQRLLTDGTNTVDYNLYQDSAHATVWGDTQGTNTVYVSSAAGSSGDALTVYGEVATGQNVPAGSYSDTITATVWYGDSITGED
ncbi:Csu type fimbrial protein [Jiella mangrovi]|uniref:Spore coat U domain-containing protein n=1 Tax=Jiella mangrovi TaxID=2821407 RepID=A0ABS4BGG1_9HYPH|nr:spore coat U domain-containing protein [Jiella mangrovi]MBP0615838.1 spore coat U domain-containing protein [Jiella mangrovi]